jgi:hypothetical protein
MVGIMTFRFYLPHIMESSGVMDRATAMLGKKKKDPSSCPIPFVFIHCLSWEWTYCSSELPRHATLLLVCKWAEDEYHFT